MERWEAEWITDKSYEFADKTSPAPMTFRKHFSTKKQVIKACVKATALGIYELVINGKKVGNEYFAPGFTSYKSILQYNDYDVTDYIGDDNTITAVVGGGWAVGRFTYSSKSKITCGRQAFMAELMVEYIDGSFDKIITDTSWQVTLGGNYRFGDFYDGETFDATVDLDSIGWKNADKYIPSINPEIVPRYGCAVTAHEVLKPIGSYAAKTEKEIIYDFGQNFAGVVSLKIKGKKGQKIVVRHAELLSNGDLCIKSLRSAKATATYICEDGEQEYSPRLTYMGFRYIGISGIAPDDIDVSALVLHSDFEEVGTFECSNELLNRLQSNIRWSGKSNFVDIPTDCPQRDERMGWTGDISIFASTACYNFDLSRFLDKWLTDVRLEQGRGGGIPLVVPKQGIAAPTVATACWADCCILVPWAEYLARGNKELLVKCYPSMKKYLKAVKFWAGLFSVRKDKRRIWKWLFQFGDWCAPEGGVRDWMKKGKWIATAYYANSCAIMAQIAEILGENEDKAHYSKLFTEISAAYANVFTDGNGVLKNEFQAGYVLPLYFNMVTGQARKNMAARLAQLIEENGYRLNTGFTGTPYLLFALADNGYADIAYKVLLQENCPSWLYGVKMGGTTFWEQWDVILPDGSVKNVDTADNIPSLNHYAYGAVGDFLYRRVLGIEPKEGGYKRFAVRPVLGGGLTSAKGGIKTPYGLAAAEWTIDGEIFTLTVEVPTSSECEITMPDGEQYTVTGGQHTFSQNVDTEIEVRQ